MQPTIDTKTFRQVGPILIRTPLLPIELAGQEAIPEKYQEQIESAIAIGTPSLFEAYRQRQAPEVSEKVLKYVRRMATRPTPFGIFAGVDLVRLAERTEIARGDALQVKLEPNVSCLAEIIRRLERNVHVRRELSYLTNPEIIHRDGRIWLDISRPNRWNELTYARETPPVRQCLDMCKFRPVFFGDITSTICSVFRVAEDVAEKMCIQLIESNFLISDLRFPLDTAHPLDYLLGRLESICAIPATGALLDLKNSLSNSSTGFISARAIEVLGCAVPSQIDGANSLTAVARMMLQSNQLSRTVLNEVSRLVPTLLLLTTDRNDELDSYANAFEFRYQPDRLVPLLDVLSETFGLGSPYRGTDRPQQKRNNRSERDEFLHDMAIENPAVLKFTLEDLRKVATFDPDHATLPVSVDIFFQIVAESQQAIDAGAFEILVAPRAGDSGAGRAFGRFAKLFSPDDYRDELAQLFAAESRALGDDCIVVDTNYWLHDDRLLNIATGPQQERFNVACDCRYSENGAPILLSEIDVGLENGRFFARWRQNGKRLAARTRNMLSHNLLPDPIRFLVDIVWHKTLSIRAFDWGEPAERLVRLPRVVAANFILAPARWDLRQLDGSSLKFFEEFTKFCDVYQVPERVWLAEGFDDDNAMLLDLSAERDREVIRGTLVEANKKNRRALLLEHIHSHDWHSVDDAHFATEFVASFVRNTVSDDFTNVGDHLTISTSDASCYPGSEWIYLRVDCAATLHEELIREMNSLLKIVPHGDAIRKWFFVRYRDHSDHLRIRFLVEDSTHRIAIMQSLCSWASDVAASGRAFQFSVETYNREIERYGGLHSMRIVESIFHEDSLALAEYFTLPNTLDPTVTSTIMLYGIAKAFDFDLTVLRNLLVKHCGAPEFRELSRDCRRVLPTLRRVLAEPVHDQQEGTYGAVIKIAKSLQTNVNPFVEELRGKSHPIGVTVEDVFQSVLHMHCNRMFGVNPRSERLARVLLYRVLLCPASK